MKNHPIAAAVALLVMVGGLVALTVTQMRDAPTEQPEPEDTSEEAKALTRELREAVQLGMQGRVADAESALSLLAERYPREPLVLLNYGVALSGNEKYDEALSVFDRVLDLRPDTWAAYGEIATIHLLREDLDAAFEALDRVPPGEGRLAERLYKDPVWRQVDDPRFEKIRRRHREVPETSLHIDDVTAKP